jgi:hypothetical protein
MPSIYRFLGKELNEMYRVRLRFFISPSPEKFSSFLVHFELCSSNMLSLDVVVNDKTVQKGTTTRRGVRQKADINVTSNIKSRIFQFTNEKINNSHCKLDEFNEKSKGIKAYRLCSIWRMLFFPAHRAMHRRLFVNKKKVS